MLPAAVLASDQADHGLADEKETAQEVKEEMQSKARLLDQLKEILRQFALKLAEASSKANSMQRNLEDIKGNQQQVLQTLSIAVKEVTAKNESLRKQVAMWQKSLASSRNAQQAANRKENEAGELLAVRRRPPPTESDRLPFMVSLDCGTK